MSDYAGAHISTAVEWNPVLLTNEWAYIDGNIETLYDDDWFQIYLEEGHVYRWTLAPRGTGLEPEDLNCRITRLLRWLAWKYSFCNGRRI